ncbi:MAG: subclass B3 metallo-beta-lactamase [Acidobacteriota bacterium]
MHTNPGLVLATVLSLAMAAPAVPVSGSSASAGDPTPNQAAGQGQEPANPWTARTPPVRIIDNIYYVGTFDLASYLITTPEGHILIDTGVPENAAAVDENIAALGFTLRDVRLILTTQAHFDHVGAHAKLKAGSGARVMVSAADAPAVQAGSRDFPAVDVDGIVKDGETLGLGGVELTAHLTPGHTRGCTTWTMKARDANGALLNVVFAGSTTVNPGVKLVGSTDYPAITQDFQRTFATLKGLPCDVFLAAHASQFGGTAKMKLALAGATPNPFIDPAGYKQAIARSEQSFMVELKKQQSRAESPAPSHSPVRKLQ